jgi:hypothetical protein
VLKEEIKAIMIRPTLASQLPVRFANGSDIRQITINCSHCQSEINKELIRGELVVVNAETMQLEAHGTCFACHTFTPISARFSDSGEVLYRENNGWKRTRFTRPPNPFIEAYRKAVYRTVEKIVGCFRKLRRPGSLKRSDKGSLYGPA